MSEKIDYSKYECPYAHLEKECGHELHSPEGYQDVYGVWCQCGFSAPVFYLDPIVLGLKLKDSFDIVGRSEQFVMDKLIEDYKKQIINDDANGYGYPVAVKNKIIKDIESNNFEIPVKIAQEMINKARIAGVI